MANNAIVELLAEALRDLVRFVDERAADATADDDVRALESVAYVLNQVAPEDRQRMRDLLGPEVVTTLGWT